MKRYSIGNLILFAVLAVAILGGWWLVETYLLPKPPAPPPPEPPKPMRETVLALAGGGITRSPELAEWPTRFRPEVPKPDKPVEPPKPVEPSDPHRLIGLSGDKYNLKVLLTNKGGGVQQVALPAFDQASRVGGTAKDENGKPYPMELVPGYYRQLDRTTVKADGPHVTLTAGTVPADVRLGPASYTLTHYEKPPTAENERPLADLTTRKWVVVSERAGTDETPGEVVFETTLGEPFFTRIRKTFTLGKLDFHVRMKLEFFAAEGRTDKSPDLHYQIAGPRNVPIEGEWYSGVHRNTFFGCKASNGSAYRAITDATHIVTEHGSMKYKANSSDVPGDFTFTAVANQFFAAALCIDPEQPDEVRKGLWEYVRATREWNETDRPFADADERQAFYADKPQLGDITVRAVSKPVRPAADGKGGTEHRYWLYHGPTKVRQLKSLHLLDKDHQGFTADVDTVENKYLGDLGLNVMTDAPAPNWFGSFTGGIGWTGLVVWFTNRMHDVLGWLHGVVPVWGLNILMLTVMVRLLLMIPSRRQQAGMLKMQEKMAAMKPHLAKLQEQYKNDPQRLNQEKTKLMLQHGVNPLTSMGGCLLMFAQMPVFLGLYYCLQESVFFRLDNFLWVQNLAAPDMLFTWSESIPFISTADQIGHSWYLGPFVNILPVVAVALMYLNFKVSSPPPTDEQQEMSQKTMKFMMIFMGVFFYKMAAGLCVYFICSTLWGLTERWLLKRKRKKMEEAAAAGDIPPGPTLNTTKPTAPAGPPKPPGFLAKVKQGLLDKLEEAQKQAESKGQQIINNPQQKPPQGGPPNPGVNGTGKRKKKRKK
jgi:YidC/Oxa1 family membrane protein insertase